MMADTVKNSSDAISGSDDDTEDNIFAHRKFKLPTRTNPFDETDDGKGPHKSFFKLHSNLIVRILYATAWFTGIGSECHPS